MAHAAAVLSLTAQLAEARALLNEVEWAGNPDHTCPICEGMPDDAYGARVLGRPAGHSPDCRLAKFLGGK